MSVISSIITKGRNKTLPVLVEFQNGKLNDNACKLNGGLYRTQAGKTIVNVETERLIYTGEVDSDDDLYNNFLLIHNKKKNKIKLIQVDYALLSPQIEKEKCLDITISEYNKSVVALNREFGSKKTKRITEQKERLKLNIDSVKEQLERTVADITINESDLGGSQTENPISSYRPPINYEASTRDLVYELHNLVPDFILKQLEDEADTVLTCDLDNNEFSLPTFIRISMKRLSLESNRDIHKATVLVYVYYLIKFILTPAKNITKRFQICENFEVNRYILDNFSICTGATRTRPLSMKDKLLCYIMILSILALDYEINIETLSKDIKIGLKKLQDVGRLLALSSVGKNVMGLKLPLPTVLNTSSKRKRK